MVKFRRRGHGGNRDSRQLLPLQARQPRVGVLHSCKTAAPPAEF